MKNDLQQFDYLDCDQHLSLSKPSIQRAHFVGISGSGMAGVALVAHQRGIKVSGSDLKESSYVQALLREGVSITFEHDAHNLDDPSLELVVRSTAILESNPEIKAARERGLTVWSRAQMLAHLGLGLETLAVAGTHGKTSTASMLATSLIHLGADPTFLIGGVVTDFGLNASVGTGPHYVIEADESDGSFVFFNPRVAIVTNIEEDHLDHFQSIDEIRSSFSDFFAKVHDEGIIIACADNPGLRELVEASGKPFITYGQDESADVRYQVESTHEFRVVFADGKTQQVRLGALPGIHNMSNATAVVAALDWLGFDRAQIAEALASFGGVHRRFDRIGEVGGVLVVDDYGHHPTEIRATLEAASALDYQQVHVLFQPHRFTRTQAFMDEFATAFDAADTITLMEIYSAGENPLPGVTSAVLENAIRAHKPDARLRLISRHADIPAAMAALVEPGDLVITMGAGDVTALASPILTALEQIFSASGAMSDDGI